MVLGSHYHNLRRIGLPTQYLTSLDLTAIDMAEKPAERPQVNQTARPFNPQFTHADRERYTVIEKNTHSAFYSSESRPVFEKPSIHMKAIHMLPS